MIRQIFKQIWFYRRGSAWLFAELLVIAVVSWFVVNRIWNVQYRIHAIPDGIDYDGVYVLSLDELYPGQYGYDSTYDTDEARMENFFRVGDRLRQMPQIQSQAPISMTPCLGGRGVMTIFLDSVTMVNTAVIQRICGAEDFRLLGYRVLLPEDGELVDEPNTILISEDLAMTLFPDVSPVGKTLRDAADGYVQEYEYYKNSKITGVIANVRMSPDAENIPMLIENIHRQEYFETIVFNEEYKYAFRTVPGVDVEEFAAELGRKLESGGGLGNYRVREVVSYREMVDSQDIPYHQCASGGGVHQLAENGGAARGDQRPPGDGRLRVEDSRPEHRRDMGRDRSGRPYCQCGGDQYYCAGEDGYRRGDRTVHAAGDKRSVSAVI